MNSATNLNPYLAMNSATNLKPYLTMNSATNLTPCNRNTTGRACLK
jgi:hypothetical protein